MYSAISAERGAPAPLSTTKAQPVMRGRTRAAKISLAPIVPTDAAQRRISSITLTLRKELAPSFAPRDVSSYTGVFMGKRQSETFAPHAPTTIGPRPERLGPTAASEGRGLRS